jgi:sugar lactone lactonase YvrE
MLNWALEGGPTTNAYATTWYDQSGSDNDATQTTAANQPKVIAAGSLVTDANGNYCLDFDGTNDYFSANSASALFSDEDKPHTCLLHYQPDAVDAAQDIVSLGSSSSSTPFNVLIGTKTGGTGRFGGDARDDLSTFFTVTQGYVGFESNLISSVFSGTSKNMRSYDEDLGPTSLDGSTITLDLFTIGALGRTTISNYYDGKIISIIAYNSDQTSVIGSVEDFMRPEPPTSWEVPSGFTNTGIAYASDGTLWISDYDTGDVVNVSTGGSLISRVSTPAATSSLQGLAYDDSDDTLWIADKSNNIIRHITLAGAAIDSIAFTAPNALAYNSVTDEIWVSTDSTTTITKYNCSTLASAGTLTSAVSGFDGMGFASDGNLFLTQDATPDQIHKINSSTGASIQILPVPYIESIEHIATDGRGDMWICDDDEFHSSTPNGNRVWKIDESGRQS